MGTHDDDERGRQGEAGDIADDKRAGLEQVRTRIRATFGLGR